MAEEKDIIAPAGIPISPVPPLGRSGQEFAVTPHVHNGVDSPFVDPRSIALPVQATVPTHNASEGSPLFYSASSVYRLYAFLAGAWRSLASPFAADTPLVATQSISNDTAEGTVYTRVTAANTLLANQVYKVRIGGRYSSANALDFVTIRLKLNGVTIVTATTPLLVVTDNAWFVEFIFTVRSVGASGQIQFQGHGVAGLGVITGHPGGISTIDTTAAQNFTVTLQWSNALVGNVVRADQALTEVVSL